MSKSYQEAINLHRSDYPYVTEAMARTLYDMYSGPETMLQVEDTKPLRNGGMLVELVLQSTETFCDTAVYLCLFDRDNELTATVAEAV